MVCCVVFFLLSCNYRRRVAPGEQPRRLNKLQPVHFHKAKVKSVDLAAKLGTCCLADGEAVLELMYLFF